MAAIKSSFNCFYSHLKMFIVLIVYWCSFFRIKYHLIKRTLWLNAFWNSPRGDEWSKFQKGNHDMDTLFLWYITLVEFWIHSDNLIERQAAHQKFNYKRKTTLDEISEISILYIYAVQTGFHKYLEYNLFNRQLI